MLSILDIMALGERLGYSIGDLGVCGGISGMWVQAILAKEEHKFYHRLEIISKYAPDNSMYDDFDQLIKKINIVKEKVKDNCSLDEDELDLLEIPTFYEGLLLYLKGKLYGNFFTHNINEHDIEILYDLLKPKKLEQTKIHYIFKNFQAFNQATLKNYLNELVDLLKTSSSILPIRLESDNHSICFKYDLQKEQWNFLDTSQDLRKSKEIIDGKKTIFYHLNLTTEQLVERIFFAFQDTEITLFTTSIFSIEKNQILEDQFEQFNLKFAITKDQINIANNRNVTLLWLASDFGFKNIDELINPTNINQANAEGQSPLYIACQNNNLDAVKTLLFHGADPNQVESDENKNPLQAACFVGNPEMVDELLKYKAKINQVDTLGRTPLFIACICKRNDIVIKLIQNDADINLADINGVSPLHEAAAAEDWETVRVLMAKNADIHKIDNDGSSLLHLLSARTNSDILSQILKKNVSINQQDENKRSALLWACALGHLANVRLLLEHGANINLADAKGRTPLYIACTKNQVDVVLLLLKMPALEINKANKKGKTPFEIICESGNLILVKEFLKHKVNINQTNEEGLTPFFIASRKGHLLIINELLAHKADYNKINPYGSNALHVAAEKGHNDIVKRLLKLPKIKINAEIMNEENGNSTPLLVACKSYQNYDNEEVFKLLIQNGANVWRKNNKGKNAFGVAKEYNNPAAQKVFQALVINEIKQHIGKIDHWSLFLRSPKLKIQALNALITLIESKDEFESIPAIIANWKRQQLLSMPDKTNFNHKNGFRNIDDVISSHRNIFFASKRNIKTSTEQFIEDLKMKCN